MIVVKGDGPLAPSVERVAREFAAELNATRAEADRVVIPEETEIDGCSGGCPDYWPPHYGAKRGLPLVAYCAVHDHEVSNEPGAADLAVGEFLRLRLVANLALREGWSRAPRDFPDRWRRLPRRYKALYWPAIRWAWFRLHRWGSMKPRD